MEQKNKRILIVEDDSMIVKLIKYNLEKAGYEITSNENGQEALESIKKSIPDLIICDVMMPVMDGLELRKKLYENKQLSFIPFIFLTAKAQTDEKIKGINLLVDDYITKPFEPDELIARIDAIFKKRKLHRPKKL